jgi:hypothetical protein
MTYITSPNKSVITIVLLTSGYLDNEVFDVLKVETS